MKTIHPFHLSHGSFLLILAIAFWSSATSLKADYQSTVLADHPVGYWPLNLSDTNAGSGIATDLSGNGNNGSYVNIYQGYNNVPGPSPYITNGISFDGLSTYVDLGTGNNPALLNFGGPITMEGWVQSATLAGNGYVMGKGYDPTYGGDEISLRCDGYYSYQGGIYNTNLGDVRVTGGVVATNWVHLACTYDGANWNLFLNGALVAQTPSTNGALNFLTPWAIGDGTASANARIFQGNLSQVALYTNALTSAQVLTHYYVGIYGTTNVPPIITRQPASQLVSPGATVTFSYAAQSLLPVTNLWYKNGNPLPDETNATLVVTNVQTADVGSYSVLIGNSAGTTNSAGANLQVETEGVYGFSPIAITAGSYNEDMIIEKGALVAVTTATVDAGTTDNGTTWFEQGYYAADNTIGLPPAGSTFSTNNTGVVHSYTMASSYTTNDAVLLNGTVSSATLSLTAPAAYSSLSFLGSAGYGPATNNYVVHHADGTTETGSIVVPDWFGSGTVALGVGGRVYPDSRTLDIRGPGLNPFIFSIDAALTNTSSPVTSIVLTSASGGNTCLLALSGSTGGAFSPVAFTGYNEDMIVEAGAQHFVGQSYTTASMDNGTANTGTSWYEAGYSTTPYFAPGSGVPAAGTAITSQTKPDHHYKMAPSYTANDVAYVDAATADTITLSTPATVWALSFLVSAGHGPVTVNYIVHHADASSESGTYVAPDWFATSPVAWGVNGRVDVGNGGIQTFGNVPNLLSVDIGVTNISSPVTSIDLSTSASGANAEVFAVSGAFTSQTDAFTRVSRNANGSTTLDFTGLPGYQYLLQFTARLTPPVVWQNLSTNTAASNGTWQYTDIGATNRSTGFYRTLYLP
ncbi:MAG TPA: LamG-like jellyroll fold domain-containing protein [Verrucomicrobiae bacterium]|nr:LamG-like jellyroll fold domain-containing protein [Verrucomicrobiae bacterium]